uniref:Eukaryotic translation initiation factor 4E binding protein 1 n=1 Tax=Ovis aries TaxID=9940 RepID=A0AC11DLL7_SHEEP
MSGGSSCSQTPSRAIPTTRRVVLADGVQLPPGDYSTTPGGTLFSTTPGGTRIIYDRKFLMECRNSPVTKTPPRDLPTIPGVTSPTGDEPPTEASQNHLRSSPEDKPAGVELESPPLPGLQRQLEALCLVTECGRIRGRLTQACSMYFSYG